MSDWDTPAGGADDWNSGGDHAQTNGYSGGDAREHATNGDFGAGDDGFGGSGEPRTGGGGGNCFNCDQPGHNKADCPYPRVERPFTGTCCLCSQEGHPAALCPDKPADICKNCKKEGHKALECKENRVIDYTGIADKDPEAAWNAIKAADADRDLDDLKDAIKVYCKAVPDTTYEQLELAFRQQGFSVYLIGSEKEIDDTFTLMNLQGKLDCKYVVGFFYSAKPQRAHLKEGWPPTPEENMERLKDAGIQVDRGVPKCTNCNELGHISKHCKEEKMTIDRPQVQCVNCEELGHRARDCTQPRKDRFACRNCKKSGHTAAECEQPRSAEGVECKKCNEIGHFAKDCPTAGGAGGSGCRNCGEEGHRAKECEKPRNPATILCRNCEKMGHMSKECPEPKDWSKVKCSNCSEMGHTIKRCKMPIAADGGFGDSGGFDTGPAVTTSEWDSGAPTTGGDDWNTPATGANDWDTPATGGNDWNASTATAGDGGW